MARMPEFLDLLATWGRDRNEVELRARALREGGILSRGKRGTGAPAVTSSDAAAMLLAPMRAGPVSASAEAVRRFRLLDRKAFAGVPHAGRAEAALRDLCAAAETPQAVLRALIDAAGLGGETPPYMLPGRDAPRLRASFDRVDGTFSVLLVDPGEPREPWAPNAGLNARFACRWHPGAPLAMEDRLMSHVVSLSGRAIREVAALVHGPSRRPTVEAGPDPVEARSMAP